MKKYFLLILRLWKILKDFHKDFYIQLSLIILQQGLNVYTIYLTAKILDSIIRKDFSLAMYFVVVNLGVIFVKIIISYFSSMHAQNKLDFAIQQQLEEYSFKKIFNLNIFQYTEDHSAIKEQVINRGEGAIENIISTMLLSVLPTITQILFAVLAISFYSKAIALWTLTAVFVVILWSNNFAKYHRPFIKKDIDNTEKN